MKELQRKQLDLLTVFTQICDQLELPYFLVCGSALGAVKYRGFIPWDDDLDVAMLREDYEKLQGLWERNADTTRYACVRSNESINIHHSATEIKDNNTTFINAHSVDSDIHHGLMIDVIPIDGVPASKWRRYAQMIDSMI